MSQRIIIYELIYGLGMGHSNNDGSDQSFDGQTTLTSYDDEYGGNLPR